MTNVLLVDDNDKIRDMLAHYLIENSFKVDEANNGTTALDLAKKHTYDIILLDVMMPGIDGFEVCKTIRTWSNVPIIMITAKGEDHDKILGLDIGADDYIVKPFVLQEVVARIKAILRRIDKEQATDSLQFDNLNIKLANYEVSINNQSIPLTKIEFEILWTLAKSKNQVFTRDQLLDQVWGFDYYGDSRTVDAHIKRLRAKLPNTDNSRWAITTVWGVGYKFEELNHEQ
ncbi:response regulator transcription factor [Erysipelothrix urinaevulpis]|uniref:response regulator transcription factor n=1 Tax=Erysipelothrix urinaevulpis TaxID=2683717 RepID=UPI00135BEF91|nr:response regulator transcription factor [Erysipelothrix urinaevulpis]